MFFRFLILGTITFLLFVSCSNKKIFFQQFQKDWILLLDTAAILEEREAWHMEMLE
ncbi:MAG TPA: hypothetical protein VLZ83_06895 [Edaphocola sp.]|nr:hypothetical protein [Edaphocola sp.]